jgi:hypothetical protein
MGKHRQHINSDTKNVNSDFLMEFVSASMKTQAKGNSALPVKQRSTKVPSVLNSINIVILVS